MYRETVYLSLTHSTCNCHKKFNILIIIGTENSLVVGRAQISLNVSCESILLSKRRYLRLAIKIWIVPYMH